MPIAMAVAVAVATKEKTMMTKWNIRKFAAGMVLSLFVLTTASVAWAQAVSDDLLAVSQEGTSKATSAPEAAREIQNSVTAETARAQVIEILGEKRYQQNKNLVEAKIIRQSAKFVPFVNSSQPQAQPDGTWKMTVELKLSKASLRQMILDAGLMNDADGPAAILPLVSFIDRKNGVSLRWWLGQPKDELHKFLSVIGALFHGQMQTEFSRQGFHVIRPIETSVSPLPDAYRVERLSSQDMSFVADYFHAPMVMRGDLRFRESPEVAHVVTGVLQVEVLQVTSNRVVAEVTRHFQTDSTGSFENAVRSKLTSELPEVARELASQVLDAWQRGTLNANLIRFAVHGDLNPKQVTEVKNSFVQSLHEIKSVKERSFESGLVVFEVDFNGEVPALTEHLKTLAIPGFDTRISSTSEREIALELKPSSSVSR